MYYLASGCRQFLRFCLESGISLPIGRVWGFRWPPKRWLRLMIACNVAACHCERRLHQARELHATARAFRAACPIAPMQCAPPVSEGSGGSWRWFHPAGRSCTVYRFPTSFQRSAAPVCPCHPLPPPCFRTRGSQPRCRCNHVAFRTPAAITKHEAQPHVAVTGRAPPSAGLTIAAHARQCRRLCGSRCTPVWRACAGRGECFQSDTRVALDTRVTPE